MTENDVKKYLKNLKGLSTIPSLLGKILSIVRDENSSPEDLYRLISHDQTLAERVLRLANSALFGHSGGVKDIKQAIIFLGYDRIKSIAIGMSAMDILPSHTSFDIKNLWTHSYEVAFLSAAISEIVPVTSPRECFLSGLFHDIGRIIFYNIDHKKFIEIETTDALLEKEKEIFGCTHADAGALFVEEANMPSEIVFTTKYHHKPSMATAFRDAVSIVSLAEALSRWFSPRIEDDGIWTEEHDAILLEFSMNNDGIALLKEKFNTARSEIESFFTYD